LSVTGDRLRVLRKEADLTQEELAHRIGIKRDRYAKYETGGSPLGQKLINDFANFFNVSTDYLLGNSDDTESNQVVDHEILKELEEATKEMYKAIARYLKIANHLKTIEKHSSKRK